MGPDKSAVRASAQETIRCFVALELPPPLKANLASLLQRLGREHSAFRWVSPASLHLTLKFLGDVEAARLPQVTAALERAVEGWRAEGATEVRWSLRGAGTFPGRGRPAKVIWLGIQAGLELARLQLLVDQELAREGFPRETRPFSPHLTLARSRSQSGEPAAWVEALAGESFGDVASREVVLFRSTLTPAGAVYTPLARVSLPAEGVRQDGGQGR